MKGPKNDVRISLSIFFMGAAKIMSKTRPIILFRHFVELHVAAFLWNMRKVCKFALRKIKWRGSLPVGRQAQVSG